MRNKIKSFCKKIIGNQFSLQRISTAKHTYEVSSHNKDYILKLVNRIPDIFGVPRIKGEMRSINTMARNIKTRGTYINSISIVAYREHCENYIYLILKEKIKDYNVNIFDDYRFFGQAMREWHELCSHFSDKVQKIPWNNFSKVFTTVLKKYRRWDEVSRFLKLKPTSTCSDLVVCHNDIHSDNVYTDRKGKIFFTDLDDVGVSSFCNDLGMILANYWIRNTAQSLAAAMRHLLSGYYGTSKIEKETIVAKTVLKFALKKLYYTEAYYLYIYDTDKLASTNTFIKKLRQRQRIVQKLLKTIT